MTSIQLGRRGQHTVTIKDRDEAGLANFDVHNGETGRITCADINVAQAKNLIKALDKFVEDNEIVQVTVKGSRAEISKLRDNENLTEVQTNW